MIEIISGNPEMVAKLAEKLSAMASAIGAMEMDGYNSFSKYKFISHEQASHKTTQLCSEYKVAIIPSFDEIEERDFDGKTTRTIVKGSVLIIDAENGAAIRSQMIGADQDTMGKSCGQAETEAFKRFLSKLFRFSTIDDRDPDSKSIDRSNPQQYAPTYSNQSSDHQRQFRSPVPQKTVQTKQTNDNKSNDCITEEEGKYIWKTALSNNYTNEDIRDLLQAKGYSRTFDIKKSDYDDLLKMVSRPKKK